MPFAPLCNGLRSALTDCVRECRHDGAAFLNWPNNIAYGAGFGSDTERGMSLADLE